MKHLSKLLILIVVFLSTCQVGKLNDGDEKSIVFPKVIDTIGIEKFALFKWESPTWLSTSNYKLYFIGKYQDTIFLNPYLNVGPFIVLPSQTQKNEVQLKQKHKLETYFLEWTNEKKYKYSEESNVEILIDTNSLISESYPVLLKNISTDTIFIGYGQHIPLLMEAKDSLGSWKPVQKKFIYMCGNGVGSIILPPNEYALTLAPIFNGNYKTLLRLSIGKNHSEAFYGKIFYRQFRSMFDKDGNYNEEYKREMDKATNR